MAISTGNEIKNEEEKAKTETNTKLETTQKTSKTETTKKTKDVKRHSGFSRYAFIGGTIPNTKLRENAVFRGSLEDVLAYLSDDLEQYPEAEELIVPTEKLAEYKQRKAKRGNTVYNKVKNLESVSAKRRKGG